MAESLSFQQAADAIARTQGLDTEAYLTRLGQSVRNAEYPGPNCLDPYEIERCISVREILPERLEHLDTCGHCRAALEVAQPNPDILERVLEEVRATSPRAESNEQRRLAGAGG